MVEAETPKSHKDQGNEYYKAEQWLKAAACYTKGIKEEPENIVLYSNRCAALLKLQKAGKALADADTCIRLKPDWEKGHYRKAMVLEAMGELNQALTTPNVGEIRNDDDYAAAKEGMANGEPIPLSSERIQQFGQDIIVAVQQQMSEGKTIQPSVYFLPGKKAASGQEQMGQVQISTAFQSPDLLQSCLAFLRQYATDTGSHAACAVVPKQSIAYPQTWKMKGWPHQIKDGIFVQLESLKPLRKCWFMSTDDKQAQEVSTDYKILEPIFR
ncbi:hypothetical protein WJX79_002824 [Trebouxia sp. C0005]